MPKRISHSLKAKTSCLYKDGNTYSYPWHKKIQNARSSSSQTL
jgi:hypothetical protein